jgi:AcrR family transcriptional regulator
LSPRPALPPERPARQSRSAATRERILAAAEALLAEGDPDLLTMERIAERAHVSIGAIYKRVRGKESLLPLVLERVQARLSERLREFVARPEWASAGLGQRLEALLGVFAESQVARRQLIRALVVGYWQAPDEHGQDSRSAELLATMHAWLAERAHEIRHPDPPLALSLGLFTTLQALQTAILLDRVPASVGLERFVAEQARLFRAYLGLAAD